MPDSIPATKTKTFITKHGLDLAAMTQGEIASREVCVTLQGFFKSTPFSPDLDLVVFGSIFRNEYANGTSDVDWTLLIDGQADANHLNIARNITEKIRLAKLGEPSPTGAFGNTTISHDLIHYIGGENDTNQNITRRILLLLESEKIVFTNSETDGTAYDRVVSGVLGQYINHDSGLFRPDKAKETIPKFLFNDIVRFWRTMCVDFANKQKDQQGQKWALRNIKLRMSRKLLFVKGILMCFSQCKVHSSPAELIASLKDMVKLHPFELLLSLQDQFELDDSDILGLLKSYNLFLAGISDLDKRKRLNSLDMNDAYKDKEFLELKKVGDEFKKILDGIFNHKPGKLSKLTTKYGLF